MICARLILMHLKVRKAVTSEASTTYVGVAAILVESAVPMTALGVLLSILQATSVLWLEIVTSIWIMTVVRIPHQVLFIHFRSQLTFRRSRHS
jgi:ABC-type microcin C transport system permease subunit YejB